MVKKTISFDDYVNCLLDAKGKSIYRSQLMFRNKDHEIQTIEVNNVALNRDHNKRIVKKRWRKHIRGRSLLIMQEYLTRGNIVRI